MSPTATPSTAQNPTIPMTQARALAKRCVHGVLCHPTHPGVVLLGVLHDGESHWDRLQTLLSPLPFKDWPKDGWILLMELACPHCLETRLIEIQQSHRGDLILCAVCGRDAPLATVTPSAPTSGNSARNRGATTAE